MVRQKKLDPKWNNWEGKMTLTNIQKIRKAMEMILKSGEYSFSYAYPVMIGLPGEHRYGGLETGLAVNQQLGSLEITKEREGHSRLLYVSGGNVIGQHSLYIYAKNHVSNPHVEFSTDPRSVEITAFDHYGNKYYWIFVSQKEASQ